MDIITANGVRKHIDIESKWCYEKAALVGEDVFLKDVWIVILHRATHSRRNFEMEWYKDVFCDHEPTKDELMAIMISEGMNLYDDIAIVDHGYCLDRDYDCYEINGEIKYKYEWI